MKENKNKKDNSRFYGILAGGGILFFYIAVLTIFQSFDFAISEFRSVWYWLIPLATGFGIQAGLYNSILHTARINAEIATSGTVSGGSMVACCSHFVLNAIPILGFSGLATFLMAYQKWFFGLGILSSLVGITILMNHKKTMRNQGFLKHSNSSKSLNTMKGGNF
ncbi:hypothetical protein HY450_01850 [Candidatus Pacearchaeota archaeon]|nr:hypothetical protein [Candidatus Pacearchaeota archaeon]